MYNRRESEDAEIAILEFKLTLAVTNRINSHKQNKLTGAVCHNIGCDSQYTIEALLRRLHCNLSLSNEHCLSGNTTDMHAGLNQ